jgi:hypothetical protein
MPRPFISLLLIAAVLTATLAACGGDSGGTSTSPAGTSTTGGPTTGAASPTSSVGPTDLVAAKKSPASMAVDDPAWTGVPVTTVKTDVIKESKATGPVDVKMQALYSDTDIWFRFQWADATNNNLPNQWVFDGTKFSSASNTSDRLGLYWEIAPVSDFEARGCLANCHKGENQTIDKWYMVAPGPSDLLELWQWTAASSAPMNQVNDYSLKGAQSGDPTSSAYRESAIVADPGTGGTTSNTNATGDGPKVMQDPSKTAPLYGPNYLAVSEAVTLDASKLKAGDKISKTQLAPWVGDRADVESKTSWASGQYTVVFHRKLNTGNPDDARFTVGGTFPFGLAVWDALDQENHTVTSSVYHLILK